MSPDLGNGLFEAGGAICIWMNVRRLWIDRQVKGIASATVWFFWSWGLWNLFYYPSLDQWLSFWAGAVLQSGNFAWLVMLLWIKRQERKNPFLRGQEFTVDRRGRVKRTA